MLESMEIDPPASTPSTSGIVQPRAGLSKMTARRAMSNPLKNSEEKPHPRITGYVYDVTMMTHIHPTEDHPETPQRISVIYQEMYAQKLLKDASALFFRPVERQQALLVHSEDHWNKVERMAFMTMEEILTSIPYYEGLSLYVSQQTTMAAKMSCGGVIEACRAVATGLVRNSFAIVRPPGHHAEPDEHMGFCFFNNAAVAARVMQAEGKAKRVLILDWDVHHGNGTQKAFLDDPTVLYVSLHRFDDGTFYPGGHFGSLTSCGEGSGLGFSVNIAWPEGDMGDAEYLYAFQRIIMPIAMEFAPDLVIISAGFDAARGDDLGGCDVTPGGYAHMTHMLCSLASGKVVVALEGGYNLDSIRDSAVAVMRVLLGESPPPMPSMVANRKATETIYQALRVQSKYWKSIIAPVEEVEQALEYVEAAHFPTILKEYRSRQLYLSHKLYQLPIVDDILKQAFDGLVLCSADIFRVTTLILFIHNFGDLHVELMGEASVDVNLEKSFIMDASGEMVGWARQNGYGFIDLNVFANNLKNLPRDAMKETVSLQRKIITYVWDNFVEIAEDASVYLVAYGGASFPISELFKARDVTKKLKGVAQIIGKSQTPAQVTRVTGADDWFVKNGVVYVGVDSKDEALFGPRAGIGRIEQLSTTALRGPVVMQRCIPRLDELVKSGRPFGHNLA